MWSEDSPSQKKEPARSQNINQSQKANKKQADTLSLPPSMQREPLKTIKIMATADAKQSLGELRDMLNVGIPEPKTKKKPLDVEELKGQEEEETKHTEERSEERSKERSVCMLNPWPQYLGKVYVVPDFEKDVTVKRLDIPWENFNEFMRMANFGVIDESKGFKGDGFMFIQSLLFAFREDYQLWVHAHRTIGKIAENLYNFFHIYGIFYKTKKELMTAANEFFGGCAFEDEFVDTLLQVTADTIDTALVVYQEDDDYPGCTLVTITHPTKERTRVFLKLVKDYAEPLKNNFQTLVRRGREFDSPNPGISLNCGKEAMSKFFIRTAAKLKGENVPPIGRLWKHILESWDLSKLYQSATHFWTDYTPTTTVRERIQKMKEIAGHPFTPVITGKIMPPPRIPESEPSVLPNPLNYSGHAKPFDVSRHCTDSTQECRARVSLIFRDDDKVSPTTKGKKQEEKEQMETEEEEPKSPEEVEENEIEKRKSVEREKLAEGYKEKKPQLFKVKSYGQEEEEEEEKQEEEEEEEENDTLEGVYKQAQETSSEDSMDEFRDGDDCKIVGYEGPTNVEPDFEEEDSTMHSFIDLHEQSMDFDIEPPKSTGVEERRCSKEKKKDAEQDEVEELGITTEGWRKRKEKPTKAKGFHRSVDIGGRGKGKAETRVIDISTIQTVGRIPPDIDGDVAFRLKNCRQNWKARIKDNHNFAHLNKSHTSDLRAGDFRKTAQCKGNWRCFNNECPYLIDHPQKPNRSQFAPIGREMKECSHCFRAARREDCPACKTQSVSPIAESRARFCRARR